MNHLPIIERELRVASRARAGHIWRVLFGLAAICGLWIGFEETQHSRSGGGDEVLVILSCISMVFCGFSGAFLTADCISREKRDGTLGLLFLSNLSAFDVIIGKLVAGCLRFTVCLLVILPFMMVPLLKGGVGWMEVSRSWFGLIAVFFFSASLGVFVSVLVVEARTGIIAVIVWVLIQAFLPFLARLILDEMMSHRAILDLVFLPSPVVLPIFSINDLYLQEQYGRALYWGSSLIHLLGGLLLLCLAAWRLSWLWKETPIVFAQQAEARRKERKRLKIPQLLGLDENPYGWMIWRGFRRLRIILWSKRLLALVGLIALAGSLLARSDKEEFFVTAMIAISIFHFISKLDLQLEAIRQLHEDAHGGGMELLLATPIAGKEMLEGMRNAIGLRARSARRWMVFLSVLLLLAVMIFNEELRMRRGDWIPFAVLFVGAIAMAISDLRALPWVTAFHAIRKKTLTGAALGSGMLIHLVPWVFAVMGMLIVATSRGIDWEEVAVIFGGWSFASVLWVELAGRRYRKRLTKDLRLLVAEG